MSNSISLFNRLLTDLKERLLKVGTLRGVYLIPLGLIGLWIVLTNFKYILHAIAALIFVAAIVEGIYQLLHNPVKKQAALNKLVAARTVLDADIAQAKKDVEGFAAHIKRLIIKEYGNLETFVEQEIGDLQAMKTSTGSLPTTGNNSAPMSPSQPKFPVSTSAPSPLSSIPLESLPPTASGIQPPVQTATTSSETVSVSSNPPTNTGSGT